MNYLPLSIGEFFQFANDNNYKNFIEVFTKDAYIFDEKKKIKGIEAIEKWSENAIFNPNVKFKIKNYTEQDDRITVTAEVDGDFDKTGLPSPLLIDHRFKLRSGKIEELICSETKHITS